MSPSSAGADLKWPVNPVQDERLVLDEETFQQVLAACYALQEHADRLRANEASPDCDRAASPERVLRIQSVEQVPEVETDPVSLIDPVLPVAQAVAKQADRLCSSETTVAHSHNMFHGAIVGRTGLKHSLREAEAQPTALTQSAIPDLSSGANPSDTLDDPRLRPELVALIAEINGLLEASERRE